MDRKRANYITLKDASALCDYSPDYLNLIARKGYLKAVKIGRNWATKKEWLRDYLCRVDKKHDHGAKIIDGKVSHGASIFPDLPAPAPVPVPAERFAATMADVVLSRPPRPISSLRVGNRTSFLSIAFVVAFAFASIFFSHRDIFMAGINSSLATAMRHEKGVIARNYTGPKSMTASVSDAVGGAGRAIASVMGNIISFGKNAGAKFSELAHYLFFGETEIVKVVETKTSDASAGTIGKTVLDESTDGLENNVVDNTQERINNLRYEFGLSAGEEQNTEQGMVVVPSTGSEADDAALKEKIKKNFSDDVTVEPVDENSGVIVPQFRSGADDEYIYMMVPVKDSQK